MRARGEWWERERGESMKIPSGDFKFYPEQIKKPLLVLNREVT